MYTIVRIGAIAPYIHYGVRVSACANAYTCTCVCAGSCADVLCVCVPVLVRMCVLAQCVCECAGGFTCSKMITLLVLSS